MLLKLIKYDMRFGAKQYGFLGILLAGLILISGVGKIMQSRFDLILVLGTTFAGIAALSFYIFYMVISIRHLHSQLCSNESIMSYSLPVSANTLVASKLISLLIWGIVATVATALYLYLDVYLILMRPEGYTLAEMWRNVKPVLDEFGIDAAQGALQLILFGLSSGVNFICMLIFCMAIGNIPWLRERNMGIAGGVITFIVGGQIISGVTSAVYFAITGSAVLTDEAQIAGAGLKYLVFTDIVNLIVAAALYVGAVWLISRKRAIQ